MVDSDSGSVSLIKQENRLKARETWYAGLKNKANRVAYCLWFFACLDWFLMLNASWKLRQYIWIFFRRGKALQVGNQFHTFSLFFCKLVLWLQQLSRVSSFRVSLCLCMWTNLGQNLGPKVHELWLEYLIFNYVIFNLFSMKTLPIMEDLVPWSDARNL